MNKRKRLEYAKTYINNPSAWWEDVLFVDESKFNVFGSDGKQLVWRKRNEELKTSNLQATVKHGGGSAMVWGCVASNGVGALTFIEHTLTKEGYLSILKNNLRQSAEQLGIERTFKLYQDNDPKHKSYLVREWLLYNCPKVLETPPQSPDLNPIENVWSQMKAALQRRPPSSLQDLKRRLLEEWAALSPEYIKKVIASMPNRLEEVIKHQGGPTKY